MLKITPIPAFQDNYIWLITRLGNPQAIVVDPGDAAPVLATLANQQLQLAALLLTHHHHDHCGGVTSLLHHYRVPVFGPAQETITGVTQAVTQTNKVRVEAMALEFAVLDIPGHTRGHIAYLTQEALFCGDTLFTGGCGRAFEGTLAQLYQSLQTLAVLPEETLVYCGHEYTVANLQFAQQVEPDNPAIRQRLQAALALRAQQLPTVPASLQLEKATNPFLRCHLPAIKTAAERYAGRALTHAVEVFAVIREWKNHF